MNHDIGTTRSGLRLGYTTGSCAAGAAKAAARMLLGREEIRQIRLMTPKGIRLYLDLEEITRKDTYAECAVRKYSGDDPDITNGILVESRVERIRESAYLVEGGTGVGRVTKPGLNQPVGASAINRVPREMIRQELSDAAQETGYEGGLKAVISIPEGEKLAERTFNPRLGIEGGLSILGTSGRVEPMSEQALLDTIRLEMQVKYAEGKRYLILSPGNYGLDFLKQSYGIEETDVVKCSNFIGDSIDMAAETGYQGLVLVGHIGKLIKVAGGIMNTHSKWADCRMELFAAAALLAGLPEGKARAFLDCVTTDDALAQCTGEERGLIMDAVMDKIEKYLSYRAPVEMETAAVVFSNVYGTLGKTSQAETILQKSRR